MKYIVYKTTNLLNGYIYIGMHRQKIDDPHEFDGYLGSGSRLCETIAEIGSHNFKRETLFVYDTEKEALDKEFEIVNQKFLRKLSVYNDQLGGYKPGGDPARNFFRTKEGQERVRKRIKYKYGVDNIRELRWVNDKIEATNNIRYGGNPLSNEMIKESIKKTKLERYGFESHMKHKDQRLKPSQSYFKKTGIRLTDNMNRCFREKYGVDNPSQLPGYSENQSKKMTGKKWYVDKKTGKTRRFREDEYVDPTEFELRQPLVWVQKEEESKLINQKEAKILLASGWKPGRFYAKRKSLNT